MERIRSIRQQFAQGAISAEDLLLHLEPALNEALPSASSEEAIRGMVNKIERIVFAELEPNRTQLLLGAIEEALALVTSKLS